MIARCSAKLQEENNLNWLNIININFGKAS